MLAPSKHNLLVRVRQVVLCVALVLTFPIMMHPIHEIVEARLLARGGWLRKHGGGGGCALERAALHASRVAVVAALSAAACFVPAFGSFASFVGSTVCALLSFVLPALFHHRPRVGVRAQWRRGDDDNGSGGEVREGHVGLRRRPLCPPCRLARGGRRWRKGAQAATA